ncbi:hypothetical protein R6Q59_019881 [Mikania micrantha]|uniref:Alpha/beta hydrolase fold-3 domain-containing protein n=1 Tax=Mikania micrantha TaxID=192012 RepID=A0A5N6PQZ2_9ASTR|nr:hypothetical protein E3N88_07214 [Mikania micrantha]
MEIPPWIVLNPDGSYSRAIHPCSLPTADQDSDTPVLTKDLAINDVNKTWARIHIPKEAVLATTGSPVVKLPLVVYFHGSGFVIMSAASTMFHDLCNQVAAHLRAVVVNVEYRLGPEHRLPAAYDDGVEALHWIKSTHDPWLTNFADFSNCYLMGTSAGANLAYQAGLRVSQQLVDLEPLKIRGLILHSLFIGGVVPVESETRLGNFGTLFSKSMSDAMWDLALPVGANRDHEYCNLLMGGSLDGMERIKDVGWRVMVVGRYSDMMIDRQIEFAKTLELKGVECKSFYGDGEHGIEVVDNSKAKELLEEISSFMSWMNKSII